MKAFLRSLLAVTISIPAYAQQADVVVLNITAKQPADPTHTTLTLASGARVMVLNSDLNSVLTEAITRARPESARTASQTSDADAVINRKCAADWATDFRMQAFCRDQQRAAVTALGQRSMNSTDQRTIRANCQRQWIDDFRMQNFCEEQQLKALQSLRR